MIVRLFVTPLVIAPCFREIQKILESTKRISIRRILTMYFVGVEEGTRQTRTLLSSNATSARTGSTLNASESTTLSSFMP